MARLRCLQRAATTKVLQTLEAVLRDLLLLYIQFFSAGFWPDLVSTPASLGLSVPRYLWPTTLPASAHWLALRRRSRAHPT